jgi:hypothetical protein
MKTYRSRQTVCDLKGPFKDDKYSFTVDIDNCLSAELLADIYMSKNFFLVFYVSNEEDNKHWIEIFPENCSACPPRINKIFRFKDLNYKSLKIDINCYGELNESSNIEEMIYISLSSSNFGVSDSLSWCEGLNPLIYKENTIIPSQEFLPLPFEKAIENANKLIDEHRNTSSDPISTSLQKEMTRYRAAIERRDAEMMEQLSPASLTNSWYDRYSK